MVSDELTNLEKCGEIFVTNDEVYTFFCTYCYEKFATITEFQNHIGHEHLKNVNLSSSSPENILVEMDPYNCFPDEKETECDCCDGVVGTSDEEENDNDEHNITQKNSDQNDLNQNDKVININTGDRKNTKSDNSNRDGDNLMDETSEVVKSEDRNASSDEELNATKDLAQELLYRCKICHEPFVRKYALTLHEKFHTDKMPNYCSKCSKRKGWKHTAVTCAAVLEKNLNREILKCNYCTSIFLSVKALQLHEKRHNDPSLTCPICHKTFLRKLMLQSHLASHSKERPFKCQYCSVRLKTKEYLKKHLLIHTAERTKLCRFGCGKTFLTMQNLRSHEIAVHKKGDVKHICEHCGKVYRVKHRLEYHKKQTHMDKEKVSRPHECTKCDKKFIRSNELRIHQVVHTGERKYACKMCDKRYTTPYAKRQHEKSHLGIKEHNCKICDKQYSQASSLRIHMRTHYAV